MRWPAASSTPGTTMQFHVQHVELHGVRSRFLQADSSLEHLNRTGDRRRSGEPGIGGQQRAVEHLR